MLIFVTDLYQTDDEILNLLETLNTLRHEIVVFHLLAKNEIDLDFKGYTTFEDLETGETIQIDQTKARAEYKTKLNAHLEDIRIKMLDRRISYRTISTEEPLDGALRDFLKQRSKLKI